MESPEHFRILVYRLPIALLIVFLCVVYSHPAYSQTTFTRTYQLGGGIEVACCAKGPMSWGFTPVIQDTSLSGNIQITSISASDSGNILATDPNGVAGTTWEIFVGPAPCGFPVGEVQGVIQLQTLIVIRPLNSSSIPTVFFLHRLTAPSQEVSTSQLGRSPQTT